MIEKKVKKILILDDWYGYYIFRKLNEKNSRFLSFPIRWNILDPVKYYRYIVKQQPDFIIMNTWYKHNNWDTPKGIDLLSKLASHYWKLEDESKSFLWIKFWKKKEFKMSWFNSKIIYICDMWKLNTKHFSIFKYFNNIEFVPDKNINKILEIINKN